MKKCDWGWQGEAKKLRLRAEYLLDNAVNLPTPADIILEFDKDGSLETMSAHKIFLAIGSEVFMAMFYGPAADATQTKVLIPNYSKAVFKALVHYLYSDRIPEFFSARDDDGIWMELLECALQYGVPELATKCRVAIQDRLSLNEADVYGILAEARRLDETEIERLAWNALDARPIMTLSRVTDISSDLLVEIVQRSELKLSGEQEIELYKIVRRLAITHKGREKNLPEGCSDVCEHCTIKKDPVRQFGSVFQHIRFPLMSPSHLANGPIADGVFTSVEIAQVFALKLSVDAPPQPADAQFSSSPRQAKRALDVGELSVQYIPHYNIGLAGDNWKQMMDLTVVTDWETCPNTSRRFIQLCAEGYEFTLAAQSRVVARRTPQAKFDGSAVYEPTQAIQDLFLPLPTSENSLMHDSAGTVSLNLTKNDQGEGSYYELFISPDKEQKNRGTVFGRLSDWNESLVMIETTALLTCLTLKVARNVRVRADVDSLGPY